MQLEHTVLIPQLIAQQYNSLECKSFIGILNDINRIYITIDNKLFIWNYITGTSGEFYMYDRLNQIIVSVALVKPKPNVFTNDIVYLLVVATTVEVIIFGIKFDQNNVYNALSLYPTDHIVSTDNIQMNYITGSNNGRIFMGGDDGALYELIYNAADSWFTSKCKKINHSASILSSIKQSLPTFLTGYLNSVIDHICIDYSRTPVRLYTMSSTNEISVWSLGDNANSYYMKHITSTSSIYDECKYILKQSNVSAAINMDWYNKNEFKLIHINVVPITDSNKLVLCAVTTHLHRIYMKLETSWSSGGTEALSVSFIRLSPHNATQPINSTNQQTNRIQSYDPQPSDTSSKQVHAVYMHNNVMLCADATRSISNNDTGDTLITITRDRKNDKMDENVELINYDTLIADIDEINALFYSNSIALHTYSRAQLQPLIGLNEYTLQHCMPARQFIVLTSSAVLLYSKQTYIDQLKSILINKHNSGNDTELQQFIQLHSLTEVCCMCICIATSIPAVATTALQQAAAVQSPNKFEQINQQNQQIKRLAISCYIQYSQEIDISTSTQSSVYTAPQQKYTARVESITLYMSRLLRTMWFWPLISNDTTTLTKSLTLRYDNNTLVEILKHFTQLQSFIVQNKQLIYNNTDANEQDILSVLIQLLVLVIELINLLIIVSNIIGSAAIDITGIQSLDRLYDMKLCDIICTIDGHTVLKQLIESLILQLYSDVTIDVNDIINQLQQNCGTLFKTNDILMYQGNQALQQATALYSSRDEFISLLDQSLQYYIRACRNTIFDIIGVTQQFRIVHAYTHAIQLILKRTELLTSHETQQQLSTSQPIIEPQLQQCYTALQHTLAVLLLTDTYPTQIEQIQRQKYVITPDQLSVQTNQALFMLLQSDNVQLHHILYEFFISNNLIDQIYHIRTPYIIDYLSSQSQYTSVLKDYYIHNQMYESAVSLLTYLAVQPNTPQTQYTLQDRIEFMTRAHMYCKQLNNSSDNTSGVYDSTLVYTLGERLQLVKVQEHILKKLQHTDELPSNTNVTRNIINDYINELNTQLLDIEQLYNICQQLQYWGECLQLYSLSGETTREDIVATLYKNIFRSIIVQCNKSKVDWSTSISDCIAELYQQYGNNAHVWMLDVIVYELEYSNYKFKPAPQSTTYVIDTLFNAGIDISDIMDEYNVLLKNIHPHTHIDQRLLFLNSAVHLLDVSLRNTRTRMINVSSAHTLIDTAINQVKSLPHTNSELDDQIDNMLNQLISMQQSIKHR